MLTVPTWKRSSTMVLRQESQLTAAMFYKDTAGKMDVADPTIAVAANANHGLKKRYAFNQESGVIEMAGPLFCDVFKSERLLLSFVDLKVILNRNVNAFCLMSDIDDAAHKVKLTEAYLKVRKVKVSPSVSIAHKLALKKGPAIYPVRRVECKAFIIPTGNPSLRKDNLYNGLVPKTYLVPTSACSPAPESYFMIPEMAFHEMILKAATLCTLPT